MTKVPILHFSSCDRTRTMVAAVEEGACQKRIFTLAPDMGTRTAPIVPVDRNISIIGFLKSCEKGLRVGKKTVTSFR